VREEKKRGRPSVEKKSGRDRVGAGGVEIRRKKEREKSKGESGVQLATCVSNEEEKKKKREVACQMRKKNKTYYSAMLKRQK
jgi:hypothetical protein